MNIGLILFRKLKQKFISWTSSCPGFSTSNSQKVIIITHRRRRLKFLRVLHTPWLLFSIYIDLKKHTYPTVLQRYQMERCQAQAKKKQQTWLVHVYILLQYDLVLTVSSKVLYLFCRNVCHSTVKVDIEILFLWNWKFSDVTYCK